MKELKKGLAKRLAEVLSDKQINAHSFAKSIGKTNSNVYALLDPDNPYMPGMKFLLLIFEQFPTLSKDWFLEGKGEKWIGESKFEHPLIELKDFRSLMEHISEIVNPEFHCKWVRYETCLYDTFNEWVTLSDRRQKELDYRFTELQGQITKLPQEQIKEI